MRQEALLLARSRIELTDGQLVAGYVVSVRDFGVFVRFCGGLTALAPKALLSDSFTEDPSSLFAEGDEGEDEDEGEGEDGDADVPRRGGSVTARLQLRRGDVAADGRAAFELVSPLETLASVQALHAELCRRAAERTGRGVDGVSVAFIDNAGDKVAVDEFTSILDVKREAVSLIVTPTFSLSAESE